MRDLLGRILLALIGLWASGVLGATVEGTLEDALGTNYGTKVSFKPRGVLSDGRKVYVDIARSVSVTNGAFTAELRGGLYDTDFGYPHNPIPILVPMNDTNTYNFGDLARLAANASMFPMSNLTVTVQGGAGGGVSIKQGSNVTTSTNGSEVTISAQVGAADLAASTNLSRVMVATSNIVGTLVFGVKQGSNLTTSTNGNEITVAAQVGTSDLAASTNLSRVKVATSNIVGSVVLGLKKGSKITTTTNGNEITVSAEVGQADLDALTNTFQLKIGTSAENLFEVADTNTSTIRFAVGTNGVTYGDASGMSNYPSAGTSGALTNNETRAVTVTGPWTFSGGISAPGLAGYDISATGTTTNNTAQPIWTNTIPGSNAYMVSFWGAGSGPTNNVAFHREALFWRGSGPLLWVGSNAVSTFGSSGLTAYAMTNTASNVVLYVKGAAGESMNWAINGFAVLQTNGLAAGGGGGTAQLDPSTNVYLNAYYDASEHSGLSDGTAVTNLTDASGAANLQFAGGGGPTKETVGGNTVLRFDGVLDTLYTGALEWNLNFLRPEYGVIVARFKPAANTQAMLFSYQNSGGDLATMWAPYDGALYFDWQNASTGRVQASEPSGWTNGFHTLVIKRTVDASNNLILRVDGVTLATVTASSASFGSTTGTFVLGARPDGAGNFWAGDFDAMAFFEDNNMSLTDADAYGEWMANH